MPSGLLRTWREPYKSLHIWRWLSQHGSKGGSALSASNKYQGAGLGGLPLFYGRLDQRLNGVGKSPEVLDSLVVREEAK